jgi:hypothetical protein
LTVRVGALVDRPAAFVQLPEKFWPAVSVVRVWGAVHVTGLLIVSAPLVATVTSLTYQPLVPRVPDAVRVAEGGLASRLIVLETELVPPALVAVQVNVTPVVSVVTVEVTQGADVTGDSGSVTVHVTETALVYQSFVPSVPLMFGVMTGGVVSDGVTGPKRRAHMPPSPPPSLPPSHVTRNCPAGFIAAAGR